MAHFRHGDRLGYVYQRMLRSVTQQLTAPVISERSILEGWICALVWIWHT